MKKEDIETFIEEFCTELNDSERLLPGGYVYLSDMMGEPDWLRKIGRVIASYYMDKKIDAVMTVATKGVPIAQAVATYLNVPFVIVNLGYPDIVVFFRFFGTCTSCINDYFISLTSIS